MESKEHKTKRWAADKAAGNDGEDWAKLKHKVTHPFDEVGSHKKNDDPYDIYYKSSGKPKIRVEVKLNDTPLSEPQKEFQKKPNTDVMRVGRNNPVHIGREIGRKFKENFIE